VEKRGLSLVAPGERGSMLHAVEPRIYVGMGLTGRRLESSGLKGVKERLNSFTWGEKASPMGLKKKSDLRFFS